jgi:arylsulfatase A-like enzyme
MHAEPFLCDDRAALHPLGHAQRAADRRGVRPRAVGADHRQSVVGEGYATGHFGKWHLGNVPGRLPTDQGFDEWYGIPDTSDETVWPSQPEFDPSVAHVAHIYEGTKGSPSREVKPYDLTTRPEIDMEITDKAIDFMDRNAAAKKPFYAYVP